MSVVHGPSAADVELLADIGIVSRETIDRLGLYIDELIRWQQAKNLVSNSTLVNAWRRHVIDSAQLFSLASGRKRWLDLGSGGGAPGVILGILLAEQGGHIHLVEANARKCAFLRHVIRLTGASATVHQRRVETCIKEFEGDVDVVTARALASLDQLVGWSKDVLRSGAIALFPKGQDVVSELTQASISWTMEHDLIASRTDEAARIVRIRSIREATR